MVVLIGKMYKMWLNRVIIEAIAIFHQLTNQPTGLILNKLFILSISNHLHPPCSDWKKPSLFLLELPPFARFFSRAAVRLSIRPRARVSHSRIFSGAFFRKSATRVSRATVVPRKLRLLNSGRRSVTRSEGPRQIVVPSDSTMLATN